MKVLVIGLQGSGKSTQAKLLANKLGLFYLSTGNISRQIAKENTSLGKRVKKLVETGQLVDDKTIIQMVDKVLQGKKGFVAEGFPRNLWQVKHFKKGFDKVLHLKVSKPTIIKRLTARRICKNCGANFNFITTPPKRKGICDSCGGKLQKRSDETLKAIKKRLSIYQKETKPVVNYYRKKGILEEIDGEQSIEIIFEEILSKL